jgi:hypothetical protein
VALDCDLSPIVDAVLVCSRSRTSFLWTSFTFWKCVGVLLSCYMGNAIGPFRTKSLWDLLKVASTWLLAIIAFLRQSGPLTAPVAAKLSWDWTCVIAVSSVLTRYCCHYWSLLSFESSFNGLENLMFSIAFEVEFVFWQLKSIKWRLFPALPYFASPLKSVSSSA